MIRNNLMLHTINRIITFIILIFAIYLFFAGHNNPGGGFIGGLMTAAAISLLYITFDLRSIHKMLPLNYVHIISAGLILALGTGAVGMFFGYPFLTQFFAYYDLPLLGKTELSTAVLFDLGIYLVVVGTAMLSILTIAEDD